MSVPPTIARLIGRVPRLERLCPQQVVVDVAEPPDGGGAALVDQWGRLHPLWCTTILGRELGETDIAILESSVSRRHAELRLDGDTGAWVLTDFQSTNGSFVEGTRVSSPTEVPDGARIVVGEVGFLLLLRPGSHFGREVTASIERTLDAQRPARPALILLGPAPGGGGIVEHGGEYLQLGPTQYALVELLARRQLEDAGKSAQLRGFVRSIELIAELPWDTPHPEDNHAKQLVRRVRRAFARNGMADAIESRHGFGYRLSVPARIQAS